MERPGLVRLSKRMSLALRHDPGRFGLRPDAAGWVTVTDFLAAMRISRAELAEVVEGNDKQRFAIRADAAGTERIRASQGHSIPVDLGLAPADPPGVLYHGTSSAALASIRAAGLHRGQRHHVHLSADTETARRVGARRAGRSRSSPSTRPRWPATATSSTAATTASGSPARSRPPICGCSAASGEVWSARGVIARRELHTSRSSGIWCARCRGRNTVRPGPVARPEVDPCRSHVPADSPPPRSRPPSSP